MRAALDLGEQWNDQLVCPLFVVSFRPALRSLASPRAALIARAAGHLRTTLILGFEFLLLLLLLVPASGTVLSMSFMEAPAPGPGFSVDRDIPPRGSLAGVPGA